MAKINTHTKVLQKIWIVALLLLFSGCKTHVTVSETPEPLGVKKLLVLPFVNMSATYGKHVNVRCPICGSVFMTGEVAEDACRLLTDHLNSWLNNERFFEIVAPKQDQRLISKFSSGNLETVSDRDLLIQAGRDLKTDLILTGYVYRFRERVGSRYSVDTQASVTFELHLIRVNDGRDVWHGSFKETQQPLSENLLQLKTFLNRKARWISAREMAIFALDDMLQTFPKP
jgi:hypothetical protein